MSRFAKPVVPLSQLRPEILIGTRAEKVLAQHRSLPARRRDRIVEQSLTRGCCDDSCSPRTCLCSNPALILRGPSDGADGRKSGAAVSGKVPKPGAVQGSQDIHNFLVFVFKFVQRPLQLLLSVSCRTLPVAGFLGCSRRQRLMHLRTNSHNLNQTKFTLSGPGTLNAVWKTGLSPGDDY